MQLVAEGLRGGAQLDVPAGAGVGREDRCAREPEEVVVAEGLGDGRVHVPELATVTLVEDEDHVPGVDGVLAVAPHEVGELLDRGDDDARIRVVDLPAQLVGGLVRGDRPVGEAVVLLDGLVVQVLAVDDEDDLVDPLHPGGQLGGLEGGEGLARAGGVPDVAAAGHGAGLLVGRRREDPLEDRLGRGDLVGPHDQQLLRGGEDAVAGQQGQQRVLGEEGPGEVDQVRDRLVRRVRPPGGELEGVGVGGLGLALAPCGLGDVVEPGGVRVVLGLGAVGDDEDLDVAEQASARPEGVALVAVDLVEGLADGHAAALELDVHQRQAVDEDRDVVAGVVGACLDDVLVGDLQAVVVDVLLVDEPDVLGLAVVPDEGLDVVLLDAAGLLRDLVPAT